MSTSAIRHPRRILALLSVPLLLVLAGCFRMDTAFTVHSDQTVDMSMVFEDKMGMGLLDDTDCEEMGSYPGATVEETEDDGRKGCIVTAVGVPLSEFAQDDDFIFEVDGDEVTFRISEDSEDLSDLGDLSDSDDMDDLPTEMLPEVSIVVNFPGPIIDSGGTVEVSGNTATWSGLEGLIGGGFATAKLADGKDAPAESDEAAGADDERAGTEQGGTDTDAEAGTTEAESTASDSSNSWILWLVIGLGALAVILVIVLIVVLAKRKSGSKNAVAQDQQFAQQGAGQYAQQGQQYPQQGGQYPLGQRYPQQGEQYPPQDPGQQFPEQGGQPPYPPQQ